ncbi:hypothetical protein TNCV_4841851 [Trichonephila clavipes]|uniref:Uncharacterized protein n=1 Tax=Trichonephila clavipes TaxID=2585209 RepID=A0A8X7BLS1_TRICX|nr:hypothetical protein TNCV_4841851 [Trichonephila clavipes]
MSSEMRRQVYVSEMVRSCGRVGRRSADTGLLDAAKQILCAGHVSRSDDDLCSEILCCSHRCLIHRRFQVDTEEEIQ